ncbi:hypothetical protein DFH06DRAFT_1190281 [Mycena polygramma]|nr:hypothetical protein DFH06DRAFT_1190281 [Mycena polygramma]
MPAFPGNSVPQSQYMTSTDNSVYGSVVGTFPVPHHIEHQQGPVFAYNFPGADYAPTHSQPTYNARPATTSTYQYELSRALDGQLMRPQGQVFAPRSADSAKYTPTASGYGQHFPVTTHSTQPPDGSLQPTSTFLHKTPRRSKHHSGSQSNFIPPNPTQLAVSPTPTSSHDRGQPRSKSPRMSHPSPAPSTVPPPVKMCLSCKKTSTSLWRKDPDRRGNLCNACYLKMIRNRKRGAPELIKFENEVPEPAPRIPCPDGNGCRNCNLHFSSVWYDGPECRACYDHVRMHGEPRPQELCAKLPITRPRKKAPPEAEPGTFIQYNGPLG